METQSLHPCRSLDVLYVAESRASEAFSHAVNLLMIPSRVKSLLIQGQRWPGGERFKSLWQESAHAARSFRVERRITDWVFENFWDNPHEPKHSKLLAYFLKPDEEHDCGEFLLGTFCDVLKSALEKRYPDGQRLPTDSLRLCRVDAEKGGRIDVSITCDHAEPKWTVIIENKINDAVNQNRQLERYVERRCREGYKLIFVFYLTRSSEKEPHPDDLKTILKIREDKAQIFYAPITYEHHIRQWLDSLLEINWQPHLNQDIREHLSYYRRLIAYLSNRNKTNKMNSEILKSIRLAEEKGEHLTLAEIDAAITSANALKEVFVRVLRGRFLRRIQEALCKRGLPAVFYYCEEWPHFVKVKPESDYAPEFERQIIVGVEASNGVFVGYGWDKESPFFFGYLKLPGGQGHLDDLVKKEAGLLFREIIATDNDAYYAWKCENPTPDQLEREETATEKVGRICEMRERLQQALPK